MGTHRPSILSGARTGVAHSTFAIVVGRLAAAIVEIICLGLSASYVGFRP
jgi:hypothetical protein